MKTPEHNNDNGDLSALHQALVDKLQSEGHIRTPRVEAAFRTVPRHLFLPGVSLSRVYSDGLCVLMRPPDQSPPVEQPDEPQPFELFARSFGPDETLAHRLLDQVAGWDAAGRPSIEGLRLRSYPPDSDYVPSASELAIQKQWSQLVLDWQ
jgi:hypothetical protein